MAIIRKSELRRHVEQLEARYQRLREAVDGIAPNRNLYEQYATDPDEYAEDFTEVDVEAVAYALSDFRTVLKRLDTIHRLQAHKLKSVR